METQQFVKGMDVYKISATVILCGIDVAVIIGGGEKSHIGAMGLASPRPSLQNKDVVSASVSVLCVLGHKDDLLARAAALRLASKFNVNVVVSVGLHLDNATTEDIEKLQTNFEAIIVEIEKWLLIQKLYF
ncbi:MAG: hypothetical protein WC127_01025 [Acidaminococcaceae bacterium]